MRYGKVRRLKLRGGRRRLGLRLKKSRRRHKYPLSRGGFRF